MFLQLGLLPPLSHEEAIGTLGYPIASKLEDLLALEHSSVHRQTNIGVYNKDENSIVAPGVDLFTILN